MDQAPDQRRPQTRRVERWGLLLVTVGMGVALVATSVASFQGARKASAAMARNTGLALVQGIRRDVMRSSKPLDEILTEAFSELKEEGLRSVQVLGPRGRVIGVRGEPQGSLDLLPTLPCPRCPAFESLEGGRRNRAFFPIGRGRSGRRAKATTWPPGDRPGRGLLVLEYEPVEAELIRSRALVTLLSSLAASVLLLLAAAFFWRQSIRNERISQQLWEDRHLKSLGQMSAVLGHELRNPLASLKGHAQLIVEDLPAEHSSRDGAEVVVREALRLENLITQILGFAKNGNLDIAPVEAEAVVRAAIERAGADPVELSVDLEDSTWPMDRAHMEQVLVNLLDNARQATPDGATIEVLLATQTGRLLIAVRDHGPGLAPGDAEQIFEPFYTKRVKGTGLGLALARRIVEGHGGQIGASNHPGGGAQFQIALPRV